ncbi:hypothetical protein BV25DRAFT_1921739 [Artomyces pyxidatus]|uniref:Uncharacterized protein n=1 Tax=Artomyces pyxidatus TaxID=48021 RepID=A0ACB8SIC6_9AGAM|nr:hypothetical protein BV25DRAFT_1921739 [Artomyces pyxidatus]
MEFSTEHPAAVLSRRGVPNLEHACAQASRGRGSRNRAIVTINPGGTDLEMQLRGGAWRVRGSPQAILKLPTDDVGQLRARGAAMRGAGGLRTSRTTFRREPVWTRTKTTCVSTISTVPSFPVADCGAIDVPSGSGACRTSLAPSQHAPATGAHGPPEAKHRLGVADWQTQRTSSIQYPGRQRSCALSVDAESVRGPLLAHDPRARSQDTHLKPSQAVLTKGPRLQHCTRTGCNGRGGRYEVQSAAMLSVPGNNECSPRSTLAVHSALRPSADEHSRCPALLQRAEDPVHVFDYAVLATVLATRPPPVVTLSTPPST